MENQDLYEGSFQALDRKYFNSTMNYTLSLLSAFDHLYYYVQETKPNGDYYQDKAYKVPITFGNYEKSIVLEDVNESSITTGNLNIIPRMVLSFNSITKNTQRQTQKYQKFSRTLHHPDDNSIVMDMSYNSLSYDFEYTLLLQARGLTMATQLTEQILTKFNPSMNLNIKEFPLFNDFTQTQILIQDPEFEITEEFEETQVNIVNVSFNITIRGNIYSDIGYQGPIKTVHMFSHVWDEFSYNQSKLSSYYKFDVDQGVDSKTKHQITKETLRQYDGTVPYTDDVRLPVQEMEEKRPDFNPPEIQTILNPEPKEKE
jgi:hypothetical protein